MSILVSIIKQWRTGMGMEGSGHGMSEIPLQHLLEGTEKSQWKSVRLAGAMDKIHTRLLPSKPIPSVDLYNIIHHHCQNKCLVHIPATSVCPYPSSYNSLPVHLCWCQCSVKSQMMGLILQGRPKATLLMAVLSILKCVYKIGRSSSYHISGLCPIPPLRSASSEDSCNIPSCFHMAL